MTVVVNAEDILGRVLTLVALAHLSRHLLSVSRHTVVPDARYSSMALSESAVTFVTEESWELGLFLMAFADTWMTRASSSMVAQIASIETYRWCL